MAIGGNGTFTGTTDAINTNIMIAIKAEAGITDAKIPMVFKGIHFESTSETTIIINNRIPLKLKPSLFVSGNYAIDLDDSYKVGSIIVVDTGIAWEITGQY